MENHNQAIGTEEPVPIDRNPLIGIDDPPPVGHVPKIGEHYKFHSPAIIAPLWMYCVNTIHKAKLKPAADSRQLATYNQYCKEIERECGNGRFMQEKLKTFVVYNRKRVGRYTFSSCIDYEQTDSWSYIPHKRNKTDNE